MRVGAEHSGVPTRWPSRLERPPGSPPVVYLDLNHWIALTKAATDHPGGLRFKPVLEAMQERRADFAYVIGLPLIIEITGNRRRAQRADLTALIEDFTDFACVMPLPTIAALEFESSLCDRLGARERFASVPAFGRGVLQAAGRVGGLTVRDPQDNDVTARVRREYKDGPEAFDRWRHDAEREADRSILRGPQADDEEAELGELGWDPSVARKGAELRAADHRKQASLIDEDDRWRRGRLRDVMAARYQVDKIEEVRDDALAAHGVRIGQVLRNPEEGRRFTDEMPAADVWITLWTAKHRNRSSKFLPNDVFDVDALAVAAAYCDVVVTEGHAAHVLNASGAARRLDISVYSNLDELVGS